ncbi:glycosyltransferase family 2 protein [Sphingosinicella sp. BN140058]|nr:glycosyltransferase family 2 protein [Sphingosinicella sp. BN140058]
MVANGGGRPRALSVVMPVRNAGPFLDASIRSILDQTLSDFEFVIRDDGSTDGSTERLRNWAARDPRIRLFIGEHSLGPAASSNWVVSKSSGRLVARMDADDIAHPDRLMRQAEALEAAPSACLVGSLWEGIDEKGRHLRPRDRWRLSRSSPFSPFPHGSIMFRRDAFERAGGYRCEADFWEDADLYFRMAEIGRLLVLPDALYFHRSSALSTRLTSEQEKVETSVDRMYRRVGGITADPGDGKVLPRVFVSLGSTRLWSGRSPAVLGRLLRRGRLGWNAETAAVLFWAAWGAVSPSTLRACLRTVVRLRDRAVRARYADGCPCEWRIGACSALHRDEGHAGSDTGAVLPSMPDLAA